MRLNCACEAMLYSSLKSFKGFLSVRMHLLNLSWSLSCSRDEDGDVTVKPGSLLQTMDCPSWCFHWGRVTVGAADGPETWSLSAEEHHVPTPVVIKQPSQQLSHEGPAWGEPHGWAVTAFVLLSVIVVLYVYLNRLSGTFNEGGIDGL